MDVDGVLTDGRLYHCVDRGGRLVELKGMDSQDGISLVWLAEAGIRTGIISGRVCEGIGARAKMLRMSHIVQGRLDKLPAFEDILRKARLRPEEAAFIGDDLTDVPVLRAAGWGVAVANARPEAKAAADHVTRSPGGRGAVREVAELLLKAHGLWSGILRRYGALALALALQGCGALAVQVGDRAVPEPIPQRQAPPKDEEAAVQNALQFIVTQQHSYKISPADLLEVTVYQEQDLNRKVRVSPEGTITLPLIDQPVKVAGLGVAQAEEELKKRLSRFLRGPQVSVFIAEYGNKQVYILGEVAKPGSYPLPTEAPLSVVEAVTLAGGFTQYAAFDRTRVIRKAGGENKTFIIEVSAVTKRGDKSKDIVLEPGDVIFVPESFF